MRFERRSLYCAFSFIVLVIASFTAQSAAAGQPVELAYDDGKHETSWTKTEEGLGGYDAVRFSLPVGVMQVLDVRYFIVEDPSTFNVLVLDSNRNPVHEAPVSPTKAGWFTVDLSAEELFLEGEFYAAMKWSVPDSPRLGADESNPDGRSFFVDDGTWRTYREVKLEVAEKDRDGDFMIRAAVAPVGKASFRSFVTCKAVDETRRPLEAVHPTDEFDVSDQKVYALLVLDDVQPPVIVDIVYIGPGGNEYARAPYIVKESGMFSYYAWLEMTEVRSLVGEWRVEAYVNHVLVSRLAFELTAYFLFIQHIEYDPTGEEPYYAGDVASITYTIGNTGSGIARNVEVRVVGINPSVEVLEVTPPSDLEPGASGRWQVKLRATEPGDYEVHTSFYVNGEKVTFGLDTGETVDQFKVTMNASERPLLGGYGLYVAVGAIVIIVILLGAFLMRRKRATPAPVTVPPAAPTIVPSPSTMAPAARKFCISCGAPIPETSKFCSKCGTQQP